MASGHVNRVNRPNIWLLRPSLQSEDSSCQPGAVHTWPLADMPLCDSDVRFRGQSGHFPPRCGLLLLTQSRFNHLALLTCACRQRYACELRERPDC